MNTASSSMPGSPRRRVVRRAVEDASPGSEALYGPLVDAVKDYAIFLLDVDGCVTSWNPGGHALKGYTAAEIMGEHFSVFYEAEDRDLDKPAQELETATAEGRFEDEGWRVRKDGSRFWANVIITPVLDAHGDVVGFAKVTRDLSELRRLEQERLQAAVRSTHLRDEMLSIVAHDLGNPVNTIGLWARCLLASAQVGPAGDEVREAVAMIQAGVQRMAVLLADLGDVASIDSGRLSVRKHEGDAATLVTETVSSLSLLCAEKDLTITGRAPALRLTCDWNRVQQVLGNLVANAIKFTPRGGAITVEASGCGDEIRFSVGDTGPGIAEELRAHVFERYWRGAERDDTKGVGLGLFIAKGIIESHGGRIWLESTLGGGSSFCFTLPLAGT